MLKEKTAQASVSAIETRTAEAIIKALERPRRHGWSNREVFRDWLGLTGRTLQMMNHHYFSLMGSGQLAEDPDEIKTYWEKLRERYDTEDFACFQKAFHLLLESSGECYMDVVGKTFMLWDCASDPHGQFFTPWPVAYAMAKMTVGLTDDQLKNYTTERPLTVCDPCCGSGVMLLACAAQFDDAFVRSGRVRFYGQDLDQTCVEMARINERLYALNRTGLWLPSGMEPSGIALSGDSLPAHAEITLQGCPSPS